MKVSLRLIIALVCSAVVLIVAASTFAVSYSISLSTVRDLGQTQTLSLARTARVEMENYFERPVQDVEALRRLFLQQGVDLPSSLSDQTDPRLAEKAFAMTSAVLMGTNYSYRSFGFILDDGSSGYAFPRDGLHVFQWRNVYQWPTGNMSRWEFTLDPATGIEVPFVQIPGRLLDTDGRVGVYQDLRPIVRADNNGAWYSATLYQNEDFVVWTMPAFASMHNRSGGYVGCVIVTVDLDRLSGFLRQVVTSSTYEQVEAFALDRDQVIVGSSHEVQFSSIRRAPITERAPIGCVSADSTSHNAEGRFIGCLTPAREFPYAPLRAALAVDAGTFIATTTPAVRRVHAGGDAYFVAATPVENRYRFFQLNVVLCVPEEAVLGDLVKGRNIVLGLTAAIVVIAAGLSAALVTVMLQPLADVAYRMTQTARLRDEAGPVAKLSAFTEIRRLQAAYADMSVALQSFTRYVPRDVVKDLMASGELCTIRMRAQRCTMLFCDIAGFTTICERVPVDALSAIVTRFFERSSALAMEHGGMVDKFIGDCVMAVWGAPFEVANQEVKAVLAAKLLNWETRNAALGEEWDAAGEALCIRAGIGTGEVLAGNMGSRERMNYTVIGDAVNLASRLESLNKQFDTEVMIDAVTALPLRSVFVLRLLLPIAVVGKAEAVRVYEVVGLASTAFDTQTLWGLHDEEKNCAVDNVYTDNPSSQQRSVLSRTRTESSASERAGRASTVSLLTAANKGTSSSQQPLMCTPIDESWAQLHTQAVEEYLERDFARSMATIERSRETAAAAGRKADGRAADVVEGLCRQYIASPPTREQFNDGVFEATSK